MIKKQHGSDLFIVDNSDVLWKVGKYLNDWCEITAYQDECYSVLSSSLQGRPSP